MTWLRPAFNATAKKSLRQRSPSRRRRRTRIQVEPLEQPQILSREIAAESRIPGNMDGGGTGDKAEKA
jgi:hypothetical protein